MAMIRQHEIFWFWLVFLPNLHHYLLRVITYLPALGISCYWKNFLVLRPSFSDTGVARNRRQARNYCLPKKH